MSGAEVDLGTTLSAYNSRQFHHIYPKGYLKTIGIDFHAANRVANICFLPAVDNNSISDSPPSTYFSSVPTAESAQIFESAVIPMNARDGNLNFPEFLAARSAELQRLGKQLMQTGSL